ncbi:MAG: hypothetical protein ABSA02_00595 [Trebonia sp.]
MSVAFLWINVPLMVLAFALWVGVPMWMVFRHPDRHPRETRVIPVYLKRHPDFKHHPAVVASTVVPAQVRRQPMLDDVGQEPEPAPEFDGGSATSTRRA